MKNTLKTIGVSAALLTACLSANTVFADGSDKIDLGCSLSLSETGMNLSWEKQDKNRVSSYKIYISDPLSQTDSIKTDIPVKYVENSSKLDQDSNSYVFSDLSKGKYYRIRLEAYNGSDLVGMENIGSTVLGNDLDKALAQDLNFSSVMQDPNTVKVSWNYNRNDNVKRIMKFYRIEADGFHDLGTADLNDKTYTFKDLQSGKKYSVAAEIYEGEKMIFTYQFGFSTGETKTADNTVIKTAKDYDLKVSAYKESDTKAYVYTYWDENITAPSSLPLDDISYKVKLSEPLSSADFFANKKPSYKTYEFNSNFKHYYIPFDGENAFDQYKIFNEAESGKHYSYETVGSSYNYGTSALHLSGMELEKYYRIEVEAYYGGKLIASGRSEYVHQTVEENRVFFDQEDDENLTSIKAGSEDGKSVDLTWDNIPEKYDSEYPQGKRTVYFYVSDPYKDRKKVYDSQAFKLSAKYTGKTGYSKLKYRLKGLTPGRHYMLYLEVRLNGKIEDYLEYELSTTVNVPIINMKQTKKNQVELSSNVAVTRSNRGMAFESEYGFKVYNTCVRPEFVDYYRKDKNGKFKKIGTAAADESFIDKNVSLGKRYTYKARAYSILDGKKVYSEFSPKTWYDWWDSIRLENHKPQLKISYANKKKKIIKITSDKNNGIIKFYSDEKICYSTNGKDFHYLSEELELKPGNTLYLKLPKKMKSVGFYYTSSIDEHYYTVKLNPNGSISKPKKDHF